MPHTLAPEHVGALYILASRHCVWPPICHSEFPNLVCDDSRSRRVELFCLTCNGFLQIDALLQDRKVACCHCQIEVYMKPKLAKAKTKLTIFEG